MTSPYNSPITVKNPFDDSIIGEVTSHTAQDVDDAVRVAASAPKAAPLPAWRRAEILTAASDVISQRREHLAEIIARESAKPIATARTEAARTISTLGFAAVEARKLAGDMIPMEGSMVGEGKLAYTLRVPRGVVGAISPFNFPLNLVAHKVAPAIAAGCSVVLKPASQTPFSALALADILFECGLPTEWLRVLTGGGSSVGNAIVEHPGIDYISFTGSAEVGWELAKKAPKKHIGLELGNSTPLIVEADADWQTAAHAATTGGFNHAGQSCISVQRVYVADSIAGQFTDLLVDISKNLKVGDPMNDNTNVSSLIDAKNQERVGAWIREATAQGAQIACGGNSDGRLLYPTVLTDTTLKMKVASEEVFGPVVGIQTYDKLDTAIKLANGTRYGLQAGIFTRDISKAMKATKELEFGGVLVNETPTWRADIMPYGGVKHSGNTKEGPAYAVRSMTEERLVVINL